MVAPGRGRSPRPGRDGSAERGRDESPDRGQIMLVGAVVLALTLVGVVVILNAVLFTENVANRGTVTSMDEAEAFVDGVRSDARDLLATTSRTRSYVRLSELPTEVANYSRYVALARASDDVTIVNVSLNRSRSEMHPAVVQEDGGSLTDSAGGDDWDVVDDANATAVVDFEMTLDGNPPPSPKFTLNVTNDSAGSWWRLQVYENASGDVRVDTENHTGTTTDCDLDLGEPVSINETAVSGNGTTCAISFAAGVESGYAVSIANGSAVAGNYSIAVAGTVPTGPVETDCAAGSPCLVSRVTAAAFDIVYVTPELTLERGLRVQVPSGDLAAAGRVLLESDFESGDLSATAWNGTGGGTVYVSDAANQSGQFAAVHEGPDGGAIALNRTLNTSDDDWVMVTWWAQEGNASTAPDPAAAPSEDLVFEYLAPNGTWLAVERMNVTGNPGRNATYRVDLTHASALHEDLELRFRQIDASDADPWYVDDVTVAAGRNA